MLAVNSPAPGEKVRSFVENMIGLARIHNELVAATFNDIDIVVEPSTDIDAAVDKFIADVEKRHQLYINSKAGKTAAAEAKARKQQLQARADDLLAALEYLDFADDVAVLNWLCELQGPSDHIDVDVRPVRVIIEAFAINGYHAGVNCGDKFDGSDRNNFHRYIVGQALDGLDKLGSIHHIIHRFADDWRAKFC